MKLTSHMLSLSLAALTIFAASLLRFVRRAFSASRLTGNSAQLMLPVLFLVAAFSAVACAQTATTTTLAVTSGGSTVTTVASGSVVTLTATVKAGTTPVTVGQVNFCNAAAAYCEDANLLATAQLTKAGTATYKFRPGLENHSYKAVFAGTSNNAASTSGTETLSVTGVNLSNSIIVQKNADIYATVSGNGGEAPTGTVSFLDASNGNAVLGTATLGAGIAGLNLMNSSNPAVGSEPAAIAAGDFNGDGIPDLAVVDYGSNKVTKLFGNGDGTFTVEPTSPPTGNAPAAITVGDFNGDGILDLAVANDGNNTVSILLGIAGGTFTPTKVSPATGNGPVAISVGDFNGDGIPDLAVLNSYDSTVTILLGNGDGTFTPTVSTPTSITEPTAMAVGDFNGDGIPDLVVANYSSCNIFLDPDQCMNYYGSNSVQILQGNGDGTFTATTNFGTGWGDTIAIAVGDFNGDGIPDLAVTNSCGDDFLCLTYDGYLTILLGNGDGTFTYTVSSVVRHTDRHLLSVA